MVRFNRRRRRYERQGLLVEEAAPARAESACLADAEARACRRERDAARCAGEDVRFTAGLAAEIPRLFLRCPPARAQDIAAHAAARGSGRVARTAAGRSLETEAVTAAVRAAWPPRSRGCSPAVRPPAHRTSPRTPRRAAAAGWPAPPRASPWRQER
ncbi:DUF2293 domain-containing protein [Streptomyces sp. AM8-1-1]|uniref:DUF2293 domain-containing protein n=1 Tax=Streptomyces sp. AM8-1-1 TaxID=3075825 RepID=UPI0039B6FA0E